MTTATPAAQLDDFLAGYRRADPDALRHLLGGPWRETARAARWARLVSLVQGFPPELLAAIADGHVDPDAHILDMLRDETPTDDPEWSALDESLREVLRTIAHRHLAFRTLTERGRDHLDFQEVGVISVRCALIAAYMAGQRGGR